MKNDVLYQHDKLVFNFNPLTGNFDEVLQFNENRIVTHYYNAAGNPLMTYDARSGMEIELGPLTVVDAAGNVVTV